MGMSTRSKTGATPPPRIRPAATISKPSPRKKSRSSTPRQSARPSASTTFPPDLRLYTHEGAQVSTSDLLTPSKPALVLFTYPRANTPGCTNQACALRDALPDLSRRGYQVWGLSYDKPKSQASWRARHSLGYGLLCDTLQTGLIKSLGAHKAPKSIKRSVFVVTKDGVVWSRLGVSPKDTVPLLMDYINTHPLNLPTTHHQPNQGKADPPTDPPRNSTDENKDQPTAQPHPMEEEEKKGQHKDKSLESKESEPNDEMADEPQPKPTEEQHTKDAAEPQPKETDQAKPIEPEEAEPKKADDAKPKDADEVQPKEAQPKELDMKDHDPKPTDSNQIEATEPDTKDQPKPASEAADAAKADSLPNPQAEGDGKPDSGAESHVKGPPEKEAKANVDGDGDHAMDDVKDLKDEEMSSQPKEDPAPKVEEAAAEQQPEPTSVVADEKKDMQPEKAKEVLPEKQQDMRSEPVKPAVNGN